MEELADGRLALRWYGLGSEPDGGIYEKLLNEQLGVRVVSVAGCVVTPEILAGVNAYNEVMTREIERRHGKGILDQLRTQSRQRATQPPRPSTIPE
ncbi:MAG TPA: hypothetical protein PKB10_06955 [Tepidisphaeraceae bacterium]|nr:hypothetical protein [Tepidisphaeraceae bacterium]